MGSPKSIEFGILGVLDLPTRKDGLWRRFARRDSYTFDESRHEGFEPRVLDQGHALWSDPLNHPLLDLRPGFALTLDEQRKRPDLAVYANAIPVEHLFIAKKADRLGSNSSPYAGLLEGLAGGGLGRPQALYRPALWNDPLPRLPRGDEEVSNAASWLNR